MKVAAAQIREYFQPILGVRPLRVQPGVGSFLTFEIGPRSRNYGHLQARWRLWIYLSNWVLFHGDHKLLDWKADRKRMSIIAHRLEEEAALTNVDYDSRREKTTFSFGDFRLVVSPADYLEKVSDRDAYWIFFMPDNQVLAAGPAGIRLEREESHPPSREWKKQDIDAYASGRAVRLED
jgi:hypothetical protein